MEKPTRAIRTRRAPSPARHAPGEPGTPGGPLSASSGSQAPHFATPKEHPLSDSAPCGTTVREDADAKLRQAAIVFDSTHEGMVITDPQASVIAVNPAFCVITGYAEAEVIGRNMRVLKSGRQGPEFYREMWNSLLTVGRWHGEIWNRRKNGEIYPQWATLSAVRDQEGGLINYVGVFTDITRLKRSEAQFEHLARHDPLTGLPNRLVLQSHLEKSIARAERSHECCAVLFLDLDRFKYVNDSRGHTAGDELLCLASRRIAERIRSADTLVRMGGDEFVLLLDDLAGPENAAAVATSIIDQFRSPFVLADGFEVYIGASIGISLCPHDGTNADKLIQFADGALYQAKRSGRGTYRFYDTSMTVAANARIEIETQLRHALERDEFLLHYQPLVSMSDGRIVSVEALVRWQHPAKGLVPPDQFIPVAEETGLIAPLCDWVLRTACRQMQKWIAGGSTLEAVAVNVSPRQLQQHDLIERLQTILAETGLSPHRLELEITETALLEQEAVDSKLPLLRALGIRISLDDFGTGYSSLAYLSRCAIDKIKIDRSFVHDMSSSASAMQIITAIIALAKSLKVEVVAEGVERQAQLALLRRLGCDAAQGFLFGRPVPADQLDTMRRASLGTARHLPRAAKVAV